jgi:hypothetical protein
MMSYETAIETEGSEKSSEINPDVDGWFFFSTAEGSRQFNEEIKSFQ